MTPADRAKRSAAMRARWQDPEYRARMIALHRGGGSYRTPEWREKMANALTKRPPPGTPERRAFNKVAKILGAAAAHREMQP